VFLADDVPAEVKARRLAELFAAYRQGQAELNAAEVGRVHLVLLDGRPRRGGERALQGRTCSMKRAIIPEQALPKSLASLKQQHMQQQQQQQQQRRRGMNQLQQQWQQHSSHSSMLSKVGPGDYVAVLVQQVAGTGTLLSVPLAKTSVQEFAAVFDGSTTPDVQLTPRWLQAAGAAVADDVSVADYVAAVGDQH